MAFAPKPSVDPRWAVTLAGVLASSNIVVPPSGLMDAGWAPASKPPAQNMNWWMNIVTQWAAYLRDYELQPHVYTPASDTAGVREVVAGTTRQLIDTFDSSYASVRLYTPGTGALFGAGLEITINAKWNGTQWVADNTAVAATRYRFELMGSSGGWNFTQSFKVVTTSPWADGAAAWDANPVTSATSPAITLGTNVSVGSPTNLAAYLRPDGYVQLDGGLQVASGSVASGQTLFTLPAGFRPAVRTVYFSLAFWIAGAPTLVVAQIGSTGVCLVTAGTISGGAVLVGINTTFPTFQ